MDGQNYSFSPVTPPPFFNAPRSHIFNVPPPPFGCPPPQWFQTVNYDTQMPPLHLPPPKIDFQDNTKDEDEIWIRNWSEKLKLKTQERKEKKNIKISSFKEKLQRFQSGIAELENLYNCMKVLKKTLSDSEWNTRCMDIETKKVILKSLRLEIDSEVNLVQRLVVKRMKKRSRDKMKRTKRQLQMQELKLHRERQHKKLDMWLDKMKEEAERAKREEQVKMEADIVLSEVTRKKSEAKRTLSLLSTLSKLRNARVQSLAVKGNVSKNEIETFNNVIGRLKKYWVDQMNEYNMEEQVLRVMLDHAEIERSDVALSLKKDILQEWRETLFGKRVDSKFEPIDMDELIIVRSAWDKYVCDDNNTVMATKIPIGWVIPTGPSSEGWMKLLQS